MVPFDLAKATDRRAQSLNSVLAFRVAETSDWGKLRVPQLGFPIFSAQLTDEQGVPSARENEDKEI
jgi:hypothetical protein